MKIPSGNQTAINSVYPILTKLQHPYHSKMATLQIVSLKCIPIEHAVNCPVTPEGTINCVQFYNDLFTDSFIFYMQRATLRKTQRVFGILEVQKVLFNFNAATYIWCPK